MGEIMEAGKRRPFIRQCLVTANVATTLVGTGCVVGIPAILIPSLRDPDSYIRASVTEESWIAAALGPGLVFGTIIVTILMDVFGRKKCHLITGLHALVGWFVLLLARSVTGLIAGRFLQGISVGIFGSLGSIIIGEMTDPKNRGMFLTSVSLALTIGVLLSHVLGTFCTWQQSALVCSFISFSSLLMLFYTPESPSFLISKGRYDEAREIFFWLRGNGEEEEIEFQKMVAGHKITRNHRVTEDGDAMSLKIKKYFRYFMDSIGKSEFFKPIIIMICIYTMFQFAGVNVISTFTMDIIEQVVGPEANSKLLMVLLDIERLICSLLAVQLMRTVKRRTLLFSSGFVCVLSYFAKAGYMYLRDKDALTYDNQIIPIILIAIYMFSIGVGITSVSFAIAGEIFPLQYRGLGGGISSLFMSINFFFSVKCFPVLINSIGLSLTYVLYAVIVIICLVIVWFLLPETKGRTLQDIEDDFRGYSPDVRSSEPLNVRNDFANEQK